MSELIILKLSQIYNHYVLDILVALYVLNWYSKVTIRFSLENDLSAVATPTGRVMKRMHTFAAPRRKTINLHCAIFSEYQQCLISP